MDWTQKNTRWYVQHTLQIKTIQFGTMLEIECLYYIELF